MGRRGLSAMAEAENLFANLQADRGGLMNRRHLCWV